MVLQVKDADGQGEFWDGADGTRWGTRDPRQRQLPPPPCPSRSVCPLQALSPRYRGVLCKPHTHLLTTHSWAGGAPEVQSWVNPQVPTGWAQWETALGGRVDSSSASVFFLPSPTPPHPPWHGKRSGLITTAHLFNPQYQTQNPRRPGTLALVRALVQAPVPALWDRKQVIHLPGTPCSHL